MADQSEVDLDSIIDRLLEVRGSRPGKQVQLLETEIRYLCTKAREIFISQPILLELEAPIKVCPHSRIRSDLARSRDTADLIRAIGVPRFVVISMVNTTISFVCSSMVVFHRKPTICSWEIMSTEASSHWRPSAFSSRIRSNTPKISSSSVATMSAPR